MALNLFDKERMFTRISTEQLGKSSSSAKALRGTVSSIVPSNELTGIEVRLLPPFIIDNNTEPFLFWPGYAKLYCLVIVVSDANNQLVGGIDLQGFPRIGDNEHLPINKTIFYWQQSDAVSKPPTQIHTMCSVIKSKKGLRDTGEILAGLKDDAGYKSITKTIADLAKKATPAGAALDIVTELAGVVGKHLKNVEDKPIGTIINSYTALYGDFNTPGVVKKTYPTKKINFDLEIIVRNNESKVKSTGTASIAANKSRKMAAGDDEKVIVDLMPVL